MRERILLVFLLFLVGVLGGESCGILIVLHPVCSEVLGVDLRMRQLLQGKQPLGSARTYASTRVHVSPHLIEAFAVIIKKGGF